MDGPTDNRRELRSSARLRGDYYRERTQPASATSRVTPGGAGGGTRRFRAGVGPIVFGRVFASHQIGGAVAATGAGVVRDLTGGYDPAFYAAAGLCAGAGPMSYAVRRVPQPADSSPTAGAR